MNIQDRLLDSEEHATASAVPQVAFDAVDCINDLINGLKELQGLVPPKLSETHQKIKFLLAMAAGEHLVADALPNSHSPQSSVLDIDPLIQAVKAYGEKNVSIKIAPVGMDSDRLAMVAYMPFNGIGQAVIAVQEIARIPKALHQMLDIAAEQLQRNGIAVKKTYLGTELNDFTNEALTRIEGRIDMRAALDQNRIFNTWPDDVNEGYRFMIPDDATYAKIKNNHGMPVAGNYWVVNQMGKLYESTFPNPAEFSAKQMRLLAPDEKLDLWTIQKTLFVRKHPGAFDSAPSMIPLRVIADAKPDRNNGPGLS